MQEIEDEAWSEPSISSCSLSQDFLASTFSNEFDHEKQFSHIFHAASTLIDSNASSFNEEANIEEPSFLCLLKVIFLLVILLMKKK